MRSSLITKYAVVEGDVGIYDTSEEALRYAKKHSMEYVIAYPLLLSHPDVDLSKALRNYMQRGGIIHTDQIHRLFKLESNYIKFYKYHKNKTFSVAYMTRLIEADGCSRFGLIIEQDNITYCHVSPLLVNRGVYTDIAPTLKLRELTETKGFHGILRTPIPIPEARFWDREGRWEVEYIQPYGAPFPYVNLVSIMQTGEELVPVQWI